MHEGRARLSQMSTMQRDLVFQRVPSYRREAFLRITVGPRSSARLNVSLPNSTPGSSHSLCPNPIYDDYIVSLSAGLRVRQPIIMPFHDPLPLLQDYVPCSSPESTRYFILHLFMFVYYRSTPKIPRVLFSFFFHVPCIAQFASSIVPYPLGFPSGHLSRLDTIILHMLSHRCFPIPSSSIIHASLVLRAHTCSHRVFLIIASAQWGVFVFVFITITNLRRSITREARRMEGETCTIVHRSLHPSPSTPNLSRSAS